MFANKRPPPGNGFASQKCVSALAQSAVGHRSPDKKYGLYAGFNGTGSGHARVTGSGVFVGVAVGVGSFVGVWVAVGA